PRPRAIYPPGGQAGQDLAVEYVGDVAGAIKQSIKLPQQFGEHRLFVEQNGQIPPSANLMRISPLRNVLEVEPNQDASIATSAGAAPVAMNGVIAAGDIDFFKFEAKKDQPLDI